MAMSKERLRKIHGIPEPVGEADSVVLARRGTHEAVARWMEKWFLEIKIVFAVIGFFFVLLPSLSKRLGSFVVSVPVLGRVFQSFSTLGSAVMVGVFVYVFIFIIRSCVAKYIPGGGIQF